MATVAPSKSTLVHDGVFFQHIKSTKVTLSFSKENIEKYCFAHKIWGGLLTDKLVPENSHAEYLALSREKLGKIWEGDESIDTAKIHTIRADPKDRWFKGRKIHLVMNNRQPTRFQFAPVIYCTSTQDITITKKNGTWEVFIDNLPVGLADLLELAYNDGFDSVKDFLDYFSKYDHFEGKIIHWTDKVYHKIKLEYIEQQKAIDNPLKVVADD